MTSMECAALSSYLDLQPLRPVWFNRFSKALGSTILPSHGSRANLVELLNFRSISRRRWSEIVGIAKAISKPGVLGQASIAGQFGCWTDGNVGTQQEGPIGFSSGQHRPCNAG
jgi:hypothetical protein